MSTLDTVLPFDTIYKQLKKDVKSSKSFLTGKYNLSYGDLFSKVEKCNALFHQLNLNVGDRVVLLCHDDVETSAFFFATLLAGLSLVVLDPQASNSEVTILLSAAEAAAIFMDEKKADEILKVSVETEVPLYKIKKGSFSKSAFGLLRLKKDSASDEYPLVTNKLNRVDQPLGDIDYQTPALILFTSGTTSSPKGVELSFKNIMVQQAVYMEKFELEPSAIVMNHLPLHHTDGLNMAALMLFCSGASWIRPEQVGHHNIEDFLYSVQRYNVSHVITVPAVLNIIQSLPEEFDDCFTGNDFKFLISTAGFLEEQLWLTIESRFNIQITNVYGLTETVSQAIFCGPEQSSRRMGTIGKPIGCIAKIVDVEGNEVNIGDSGELLLKGDLIMNGYFRNEEATSSVLQDGWFATGDLATLDDEGFYRIVGRKKNMINRTGLALYPEDITTVLLGVNGINEATTVGLPDPFLEEVVVSCVVLAASVNLSENEIIAYCREHLAPEKIPNHIVFFDSFPYGPAGKIEIQKVKKQAQQYLSGAETSTSGSVMEQTFALAASIFKTPINELKPESTQETLVGWDSLGQLQLVVALEKHFNISLSARDVMNIKSLENAVEIVNSKLESK